jgi:hypothetical protein
VSWRIANLEVLDGWCATEPDEQRRAAMFEALAQLAEHAEVIEGEPVPGQRSPLVRSLRVSSAGALVIFLRASEYRVIRLIAIEDV